jgi:hypothetical protein
MLPLVASAVAAPGLSNGGSNAAPASSMLRLLTLARTMHVLLRNLEGTDGACLAKLLRLDMLLI